MQQNELTESVIYEAIAKFAKGEENKNTLKRLAKEEYAHYEIWKKYTGIEMKPEKCKIFKYKVIARILGFTFAVKTRPILLDGSCFVCTERNSMIILFRNRDGQHDLTFGFPSLGDGGDAGELDLLEILGQGV